MAETGETKLCNNCKKQISTNNFMMHEMHCRRHIGLCEHCKEPFPKNEMEAHFQESHAKIKCPKCNVEVEIMHLEDHEENDCAKKPMKCIYCELEFPKNMMKDHTDYCGSRTEPCPKCGQFIMLKAQIKHEAGECGKPKPQLKQEPKQPKQSVINNYNRADAGTGRNDAFNFDEVARILNRETREPRSSDVAPQAAVGRDVAPPARRTLTDKKQVNKTKNTKPDVNRKKRDVNTRKASETEYDRLLAMQLASDLERTQDLDQMVRDFEKAETPMEREGDALAMFDDYSVNTFTGDMISIPCEFCGQMCSADDLVQHQSGCSLDRISSMLPNTGNKNNGLDIPNNYPTSPNNDTAVYRDIQSPLVQQHPSIIDNLRNFRNDPWEDEVYVGGEHAGGGEDDMLLPCEFCTDLFPMQTLVHHQAMCDLNRTMTPRPPSPKSRAGSKRSSLSNADRLAAEFPNLNSRRNQGASSAGSMLSNLDTSDDDTRPLNRPVRTSVTHKVQKPKATVVKNGTTNKNLSNMSSLAPSATAVTTNSPSHQDMRTMLKKYGAESTNRGDYYTKPGGQLRRTSDTDTTTDSWLQPSAPDRTRKISSTRTRSTLDNLLNDSDETSAHDLLAHIGTSQSRKREGNQPRLPTSSSQTNTRVTARVKASGRDIPREPSTRQTATYVSSNGTNGTTPQAKNKSSGRPGFEVRVRPVEADETSDMVTGPRQPAQRARASHVFNKPAARKRADNR